jgi:hypothetical protein
MTSAEIEAAIRPIVVAYYGDGELPLALTARLAEKIANPDIQPRYGYEGREDMIRMTCWDWFSGGGTAQCVAQDIEGKLKAAGA